MDLIHYKPTALEEWINTQYQYACIHYPSDLDVEMIADMFDIDVRYYEGPSVADYPEDEKAVIFIDSRLNTTQHQREAFFHELCHPLKHVGDQDNMPRSFRDLQEMQAAQFQYYAAMPYYMLGEFKHISPSLLVKTIAEEFMLPERFVERRLDQVKRRIHIGRQDDEINARMKHPVRVTMADVRRIMDEFGQRRNEREGTYDG
ncbi:hypothetical protein D3C73_726640 [compost metagenome]